MNDTSRAAARGGAERAPTILIVDDDDKFAHVMQSEIARFGFRVERVGSGAAALEEAGDADFDVILLDLRLGDIAGTDVLRRLKERGIASEVVVLTGHGTVENAIEAMKSGAFDFVTKPCKLSELEVTLRKAAESHRMREENRGLRQYLAAPAAKIITRDAEMLRILGSLDKVAQADAPVLILGESGTGKELVAREIHQRGPHPERPFVTVNCAVLQTSILESELFGHEKGAFTGATQRRIGLFEVADGGSIFLDEIGEIDESIQAKLLRVLQFGEYRRVGGNETRSTRVRLIAATNKDLEEAARAGQFRQDLFFRLNVVQILLPGLRHRPQDISLLADHFLAVYGGKRGPKLTEAARALLGRHSWPGNIRELENVVRRLLIFHDKEIVDEDAIRAVLPSLDLTGEDAAPVALAEVEKRHILRILARENGDKRRAAGLLGISLKTLYNKLHAYGYMPES